MIISSLADDPELAEIAASFLLWLPKFFDLTKDAIEQSNMEKLAQLAHELKGAGGSAGYDILFEKGRDLEKAAHLEQHETIEKILEELRQINPKLSAHRC